MEKFRILALPVMKTLAARAVPHRVVAIIAPHRAAALVAVLTQKS
jgi:hypothetical protein